ncbi:hypothetical protein LC608_33475 [Nostoc sp. XA010]|uniref:ribbon-helix-helix domain-containing protein n=1 Tax=Nostoc sp. XA010 TaxID=2780407 RepID=UPI001E607312|nr:ribbon-helix-helix domain-containing protein [Nostoc sp. XA010]MCC5661772.1 hypothetical protein [Nostoc sp. XA010]
MVKKTNLADSLRKVSEPEKSTKSVTSPDGEPLSNNSSPGVAPSRQGKKAIAGHFDPAVSKQLKQLALLQDTTVQALLSEALNDLFSKYGQKPIA